MRKVRDFDTELKALEERSRLLKQRKIQQFGELIEATQADTLDPDVLAGALLAAVAEKNEAAISAWETRGARFFRDAARKSSGKAGSRGASAQKAASGAQTD